MSERCHFGWRTGGNEYLCMLPDGHGGIHEARPADSIIADLDAEVARLREALEQVAADCPCCGGSGVDGLVRGGPLCTSTRCVVARAALGRTAT